jgi:hypothetical protein
LIWPEYRPGEFLHADSIELHPTFPTTFTLDVVTPPPLPAVPDTM